MTLRDAFDAYYNTPIGLEGSIEDQFDANEAEKLKSLWRSELKRKGVSVNPRVDHDPAVEEDVAREAFAFALHGLQAYMVRKGWDTIDRAQEMMVTYHTSGDLTKMRKNGQVPDLP